MKRIRRRDFLQTSAAVAAASACAPIIAPITPVVAAPALANGARELRLATSWPNDISGFGASAGRLMRRVEMASDGRLRFSPVETRAGLTTVLKGDADVHHGFGHEASYKDDAFAYFAGLPGPAALTVRDLDAWLAVGGGQDLWDDLARDFGWKPLLAGHTGREPGLWCSRPISGLADLAGRRIAVAGTPAAQVAKGIGAEPLTPDWHRLLRDMADGSVLAAEWGGREANMALGLAPTTKAVMGPGFAPRGSTMVLSVRAAVWENLSEADRAVLAACAAEETRIARAEARAMRTSLNRALREVHGITIMRLPSDVTAAIASVSDAVIAELAAASPRAAAINANYMAFRNAVLGSKRFLVS